MTKSPAVPWVFPNACLRCKHHADGCVHPHVKGNSREPMPIERARAPHGPCGPEPHFMEYRS